MKKKNHLDENIKDSQVLWLEHIEILDMCVDTPESFSDIALHNCRVLFGTIHAKYKNEQRESTYLRHVPTSRTLSII